MTDVTRLLTDAARLRAADDDRAALGKLLDAWRATRSERVARLVETVSERLTRALGPLPGRRATEQNEAWFTVEAAGDVADAERLARAKMPKLWAEGQKRVARLAARPADPRIAAALSDRFEHKPYTSYGSHPFWREVLRALVAHADPRALAVLEKHRSADGIHYSTILARDIEEAIADLKKALARKTRPLDERAAAACAAMEPGGGENSRRAAHARTEADLLADIYAAPDADEPRAVLADFLTERGDPRGEFITIQLAIAAGRATPAMHRRERELLKAHAAAWSAPFDNVLRKEHRELRRGFLAEVIPASERDEELRRLADHPAWATIEQIAITHAAGLRQTASFAVALPAMRALRRAYGVDPALVGVLGGRTPPLTALGIRNRFLSDREALGTFEGWPGLESLGLWRDWQHGLPAVPALGRIRELTVVSADFEKHLPEVYAELSRAVPANVERVRLISDDTRWMPYPEGWCVTLSRDGEGALSRLHATFGAHQHYGYSILGKYLLDSLSQLDPDALTEIVVEKTRTLPAEAGPAIRAAAARFRRLTTLAVPG